MKCCPQWVIEIVAIHATRKYVEGNLPLSAYVDNIQKSLVNGMTMSAHANCPPFPRDYELPC